MTHYSVVVKVAGLAWLFSGLIERQNPELLWPPFIGAAVIIVGIVFE